MGANDDAKHPFLSDLKQFIRDAVGQDCPYLGICLGGQLLAAALGSEVRSDANAEKGTCSIMLTGEGQGDLLFRGIATGFISFQWHNDSFVIPQEGVWLAFTESCSTQAFRIGDKAWGLQFHPEVNPEIVRNWSSWTPETAARTDEFVNTYLEREMEYREVTRRLVMNFLDVSRYFPE
jgi:GMP synthase-like glutamine amidotransferase